jgi:hypothetical protein
MRLFQNFSFEEASSACPAALKKRGFARFYPEKRQEPVKTNRVLIGSLIDLFDNPVGCLTVLQFFRLLALQNCIF